jgi:hypothetical protein
MYSFYCYNSVHAGTDPIVNYGFGSQSVSAVRWVISMYSLFVGSFSLFTKNN